MAIPDYETLMLPLLKIAGDGQEHRVSDVVDQLVQRIGCFQSMAAPGKCSVDALIALSLLWKQVIQYTSTRF